MFDLRVWDVRLKTESPMVLVRRRTSAGFAAPLRYIPSTTLRGAVITALYREGVFDRQRIERESKTPELVASPAYPFRGGLRLFPAPPFLQRCKRCEVIVGYTNLRDLEEVLRSGKEPEIAVECQSGHRALKAIHPGDFVQIRREGVLELPDGGQKEKKDVDVLQSISVAISKGRGSGVRGLLYSYEALSPGNEYWATIAAPDDVEFPAGGLVLRIGRGASRGFGRVSLTVAGKRPMDGVDVDGYVLFYALSPTVGDGGGTYPRSIDLGSLAGRVGMVSSGVVRIERVYGRTAWMSGGWDMARGVYRPRVLSRVHGSLLYGRIEAVNADCSAGLAALSSVGVLTQVGESVLAGFNLLVPVGVLDSAS